MASNINHKDKNTKCYIQIPFEFTKEYYKLKNIYDSIERNIITSEGIIELGDCKFNNFIGDITKDIKWTWAINKESLEIFENFINPYKSIINKYFNNDFIIKGCSFITLFEKEVSDSDFHFDITSHYDIKSESNTLTLIFPLYIEEDMGNLEYKEDVTKIYKYSKNNMFIWDACKLEHRTQPYKLTEKKKRVLVSINFSSHQEWALTNVTNSLSYQGNLLIYNI